MPNARVGAMPNTQAPNEADNEGVGITRTKGRRQQGITMEDLKKQTKARLAKEQRRREAVTASKNNRGKVRSQEERRPWLDEGIGNPTYIEISHSSDNSIGSSSFHSNQHTTPIYSQHEPDDFPHSKFDFRENRIKQHQQQTQHKVFTNQHHSQQHYHTGKTSSAHTPQKLSMPYRRGMNRSPVVNQGISKISNGTSTSTGKLPHGLTVQELKEMTRARLAAEAAESRELDINSSHSFDTDTQSHTHSYSSMQKGYYDYGTDQFNRNRVFSTGSAGSSSRQRLGSAGSSSRQRLGSADSFSRQRLGSADSFGSAPSTFASAGYQHHRSLLTPSISNEANDGSYSYDAQDTESYATQHGSEPLFGVESHESKTSQYSGHSSSRSKTPFSSDKVLPASYGTDAAANVHNNDYWKNELPIGNSSPLSIPTIAHSSSSFGASDNEGSSLFHAPVFERRVSAGSVVPNSVAESVLDSYSDKNLNDGSNRKEKSSSFPFSWFTTNKQKSEEDNGDDLNISQLQSEWNEYLNIDVNGKDDFPLSTFTSKTSQSRYVRSESNPLYSSPFQTVPEERVIQTESFLDDDNVQNVINENSARRRSRS